jgi:hypothetical protein
LQIVQNAEASDTTNDAIGYEDWNKKITTADSYCLIIHNKDFENSICKIEKETLIF